MLPSRFRLTASADIERVITIGTRVYTPFATLYVLAQPEKDCTRIACVVGKRVDKTAVVRHAVQRKLRAAIITLPVTMKASYDMVIVASNTRARLMKSSEITEHILHAYTTAISA